jgi:hypothetical protein
MFRISTEVTFKFVSELCRFGGCKRRKRVKDVVGALQMFRMGE